MQSIATIRRRRVLSLCLTSLLLPGFCHGQAGLTAGENSPASTGPIVFATSSANAPPLADFHDNQLTGGILKQLGDAIAAELHRNVSYAVLPRKRLEQALANGLVDGACYYRPEWLNGQLNWSQPLFTNEVLLVGHKGVAPPGKLEDVEGKQIGMVFGYRYPELNALHGNYSREDSPTMESNIKKLALGRIDYAVIDRLSLDFYRKNNRSLGVFSILTITKINALCGFSPASKISFTEVDAAINKLVKTGAIDKILANYR